MKNTGTLFNRSAHSAGPDENRTRKTVLRARGTLFWPETARDPTKIDETKAIRSEIARGIRFDRSQGPEMVKIASCKKSGAPPFF